MRTLGNRPWYSHWRHRWRGNSRSESQAVRSLSPCRFSSAVTSRSDFTRVLIVGHVRISGHIPSGHGEHEPTDHHQDPTTTSPSKP